MPGSQRYPFRRARYVAYLVSVGSQRGLRLPPPIRVLVPVPTALCRVFVPPLMLTSWFFHLLTYIKTMLKSLYDHFVTLYNAVLPQDPSLASDHALRQEQEIYGRTTKATYRNVILSRLVLAVAGSLTIPDRYHLHWRHQETRSANVPCSPLHWHGRGSCSATQRVGRFNNSATYSSRSRAITPHA